MRLVILVATLAMLTACGRGGDGYGGTTVVQPAPEDPMCEVVVQGNHVWECCIDDVDEEYICHKQRGNNGHDHEDSSD